MSTERRAISRPPWPHWPHWIDAHCHLADPRIEGTCGEIIQRANAAGVGTFLQAGVDPADWERQLDLASRYGEQIIPVFGAYPVWVGTASEPEIAEALRRLEELLRPGSCAVGEIGLDFRGRADPDNRGRQFFAFEKQLAIAAKHDLPAILHVVHAHPEALRILRKTPLPRGGIVHSFSGTPEQAGEYVSLGYAISVGCGLLRKTAEPLRRAVERLPDEWLVVESDAPDQPPPLQPAGSNEPTSLIITAREIAKLRSTTPEEVLNRSSANLRRLFSLKSGT